MSISKLGKFNTKAKNIGRTSSPGKVAKAITDLEKPKITSITKTEDYTMTANDSLILVDSTAGNVRITLPLASTAAGKTFYFKHISDSGNVMEIATQAPDTLDGGGPGLVIGQPNVNDASIIVCDGKSYYLVSQYVG